MRRSGRSAIVGCVEPDKSWTMTCNGSHWAGGNPVNCTTGKTLETLIKQVMIYDDTFRYGSGLLWIGRFFSVTTSKWTFVGIKRLQNVL